MTIFVALSPILLNLVALGGASIGVTGFSSVNFTSNLLILKAHCTSQGTASVYNKGIRRAHNPRMALSIPQHSVLVNIEHRQNNSQDPGIRTARSRNVPLLAKLAGRRATLCGLGR